MHFDVQTHMSTYVSMYTTMCTLVFLQNVKKYTSGSELYLKFEITRNAAGAAPELLLAPMAQSLCVSLPARLFV